MKIGDVQDAENATHFLAWQDSTAEHIQLLLGEFLRNAIEQKPKKYFCAP